MYRFRLVIIFVTIFIAVTSATNFIKCDGDFKVNVTPNAVRVKGCDQSPCTGFINRNMKVEVDFTSPFPSSSLSLSALATNNDGQDPVQVPDDVSQFCKNLLNNEHCPIPRGRNATYQVSLPIPKFLYGKTVDMYISVQDISKVDGGYSCFVVNVRVL